MPKARKSEDFHLPDEVVEQSETVLKGVRIPQTHPEWEALTEEQLIILLAAGVKGAESWWAARQAGKDLQAKATSWQKAEQVKRQRTENIAKAAKVTHVLTAGQTREHHCHWPGCPEQVPPAVWGCRRHWFMLPKSLRAKVWAAYRPGQEDWKKTGFLPSREYLAVAQEVQQWITDNRSDLPLFDFVPPDAEETLREGDSPSSQEPVITDDGILSHDPSPIPPHVFKPGEETPDQVVACNAEKNAQFVHLYGSTKVPQVRKTLDEMAQEHEIIARPAKRAGEASLAGKPPSIAPPMPSSSSQRNGAAASSPSRLIAREKLAINMADWGHLEESLRIQVAKLVDANQLLWMDKNKEDERGVVFACDLLMAAMACDVVREADLLAQRERTRVYVKKESWSKVPSATRLTVKLNGKVKLNPAVFNVEVIPVRMSAPKTKRFL